MQAGAVYVLVITQDATGTRLLTYGTAYRWTNGVPPVLSTAPNAVDTVSFYCDGTHMFAINVNLNLRVAEILLLNSRTGDGVNQNLNRVAAIIDPSQAYSFGCWVRVTSTSGGKIMIIQEAFQSAAHYEAPGIRYQEGILQHIWSNTDPAQKIAQGNGAISTNTWYFAGGSRETGGEINCWENGVKQSTTSSTSGTTSNPDTGFALMSLTRPSPSYYDIDISGIFITNAGTALTAADWTELYNGGDGLTYASLSDPLSAKMANYYDGDGGSGNNEIDKAGTDDLTQTNTVGSTTGPGS